MTTIQILRKRNNVMADISVFKDVTIEYTIDGYSYKVNIKKSIYLNDGEIETVYRYNNTTSNFSRVISKDNLLNYINSVVTDTNGNYTVYHEGIKTSDIKLV